MRASSSSSGLRFLSLSLFALVVSSCGGGNKSPTGPKPAQLTQQESVALYSQMSVAISEALANVSFGSPAAVGPAATTSTFSGPLTVTASCDVSGTMDVTGSYSGTFNTDVSSYSYNYNLTVTPTSCVASTTQATQVTINGDPNLTITGDFEWDGTTYNYTYTEQGGITYSTTDGRSGNCSINYTATVTYDGTKTTSNLAGTVCGTDISVASST